MYVYKVVESAGKFKESNGGIWTAERNRRPLGSDLEGLDKKESTRSKTRALGKVPSGHRPCQNIARTEPKRPRRARGHFVGALPLRWSAADASVRASRRCVEAGKMSREQNVPLILWISTAILAHIATGGGADQIARVIEDRSELQSFARSIRGRLQPPAAFEVAFEEMPPKTDEPVPPPNLANEPKPAKPVEKKKDEAKKEEPTKAPRKKAEPKKIVLPSMTPPATPPPPPPALPPMDHRIAVKQHAEPDQEDNPTAKFLADEANRVKEESVAQITAHDEDDPNPTPGGHHSGPQGRPGNSDHEKVGESDEHPGDPTHAPGESGKKADLDTHNRASRARR